MKNKIAVSVIIVNWNGEKLLRKCINSLYSQTYKKFEIIVVDNGSKDKSVELIKKYFPNIIIIENKSNEGFAKGNNIGLKKASGEYVFLLNTDTFVRNDCIEKLLEAFKEHTNAISIQPKLIKMNDTSIIDSCGSFWTDLSFLYHYGNGKKENLKKYNRAIRVFSNKAAAVMIRHDVVKKIGLFDNDFWCYYEETDFCHRAWIAGYESWYYPSAVVEHSVGESSRKFENSYIQYHNFKNKLLSFLKNFEYKSLILIIPIYLLMNLLIAIIWVLQGKFSHVFALVKGIGFNIIKIRETLKKRKKITKLRVHSDRYLFSFLKINPDLKYFYFLMTDLSRYKDRTL